MRLRSARPEELQRLGELCLRSKAVRGYDEAFLAACHRELTFETVDLTRTSVIVAEIAGHVVGVAQVARLGENAELLKLFVEPGRLGQGIGRALFLAVVDTANEWEVRRLVIDSDPGAGAFYLKMGAYRSGWAASESIPGRRLPRFEYDVASHC